ncbi:hypothetical protein GRI89_12035 [Altererythrobacter salegens]|uniref:DUF4398 domain-containing protein n=1 Tax=Croceibacterium salegens TaxID=1737568 RepID=A0A6I4SZ05_9SPHN|nr:hypothetical protein [Croceibacterium salegens]MXO60267.1 hypothetical protein [Croceibacterium salegens]
MPNRALPALLTAMLAACASPQGDYPSLAIRDAERVTGTMEPAQPATEPFVAPTPSAESIANIESLVEQANSAYESYRGKLDGVRAAVLAARGAEPGTDAWARANVAIADLETERSRTMLPLAEIDRLTVAAAIEGGTLEDYEAAQGLVGEMVDFETAKLDEIWNALR